MRPWPIGFLRRFASLIPPRARVRIPPRANAGEGQARQHWRPDVPAALNTLKTRKTLKVGTRSYDYFSLKAAEKTLGDLKTLPNSLKVLLENLLRYEDGRTVTGDDIRAIGTWLKERKSDREI